jgi:hypothetical protein
MATAELSTQQFQSPGGLWGLRKIPIIGGTGAFGSGKTVFGLTISPHTMTFDHEPDTKVWDTEGSSATYEGMFNFDRVSVIDLMGDQYRPIDLFLAWRKDILATPKGKYRVGMLDTVEEVERGLVEYVRANPEEFGHTAGQYAKMEALMWGAVKDFLQRIVDAEIRPRFETFYFTAHLKPEWKGNSTTGKQVPKGKETFEKLASLYLRFDRALPGGNVRDVPSASLIKTRLMVVNPETRSMVPMLPPRLDKATSDTIRHYIDNPPNYAKLKKHEQGQEQVLSADDKLLLEAQIASDRVEAERLAESRIEKVRQSAAKQSAGAQNGTPAPDESGKAANAKAAAAKSRAVKEPKISAAQKALLLELAEQHYSDVDAYVAKLKSLGADKTDALTAANADLLIAELSQQLGDKPAGDDSVDDAPDATTEADQPADPPFGNESEEDQLATKADHDEPITVAQLQRLNELAETLQMDASDVEEILSRRNVKSAKDLTWQQGEELLAKLLSLTQEQAIDNAGN